MYDTSLPPVPSLPDTPRQSKLGIASFILALIATLMLCVGFLIAFGYGISIGISNPTADPYAIMNEDMTLVLIASGFMYCSPVFSLVGLGLGIAAVVQKTGKKVFGIIGLVLSALILLSFCGLLGFGMIGSLGSLGL